MLVGTHGGLYRVPREPFESPEQLLDGRINDLWRGDSWFAATEAGLFRSVDGETWTRQPIPESAISVTGSGDRLFVGTYPADVFIGERDGDAWTWTAAGEFREVADTDRWRDRSPRADGSEVRSLAVGSAGRLVAGIEVGGALVSTDDGETWTDRSDGLHDDVHELLAVGDGEFVAATGNGLYRTVDAGRAWQRLDTDFRDFWYNYHRTVARYEGDLFTSAVGWGPDDGTGATFIYTPDGIERIETPLDAAVIVGCAVTDSCLYAVTLGCRDGFGQSVPSELVRYDGEWDVLGTVPAGGRTLELE